MRVTYLIKNGETKGELAMLASVISRNIGNTVTPSYIPSPYCIAFGHKPGTLMVPAIKANNFWIEFPGCTHCGKILK